MVVALLSGRFTTSWIWRSGSFCNPLSFLCSLLSKSLSSVSLEQQRQSFRNEKDVSCYFRSVFPSHSPLRWSFLHIRTCSACCICELDPSLSSAHSSAVRSAPRFVSGWLFCSGRATRSKTLYRSKMAYECPGIYICYCTISSIICQLKGSARNRAESVTLYCFVWFSELSSCQLGKQARFLIPLYSTITCHICPPDFPGTHFFAHQFVTSLKENTGTPSSLNSGSTVGISRSLSSVPVNLLFVKYFSICSFVISRCLL